MQETAVVSMVTDFFYIRWNSSSNRKLYNFRNIHPMENSVCHNYETDFSVWDIVCSVVDPYLIFASAASTHLVRHPLTIFPLVAVRLHLLSHSCVFCFNRRCLSASVAGSSLNYTSIQAWLFQSASNIHRLTASQTSHRTCSPFTSPTSKIFLRIPLIALARTLQKYTPIPDKRRELFQTITNYSSSRSVICREGLQNLIEFPPS